MDTKNNIDKNFDKFVENKRQQERRFTDNQHSLAGKLPNIHHEGDHDKRSGSLDKNKLNVEDNFDDCSKSYDCHHHKPESFLMSDLRKTGGSNDNKNNEAPMAVNSDLRKSYDEIHRPGDRILYNFNYGLKIKRDEEENKKNMLEHNLEENALAISSGFIHGNNSKTNFGKTVIDKPRITVNPVSDNMNNEETDTYFKECISGILNDEKRIVNELKRSMYKTRIHHKDKNPRGSLETKSLIMGNDMMSMQGILKASHSEMDNYKKTQNEPRLLANSCKDFFHTDQAKANNNSHMVKSFQGVPSLGDNFLVGSIDNDCLKKNLIKKRRGPSKVIFLK